MDEDEYQKKYADLRILKSIQEYLKSKEDSNTALYPVNVPDDLVYQVLKLHGPEKVDELIHKIFKTGLSMWSEKLYAKTFGSQERLEDFIETVKKRTKE